MDGSVQGDDRTRANLLAVRDKTIEVIAGDNGWRELASGAGPMKIDGSYIRERDGVTCTYRAEHSGVSSGTVVWNARVLRGQPICGCTRRAVAYARTIAG